MNNWHSDSLVVTLPSNDPGGPVSWAGSQASYAMTLIQRRELKLTDGKWLAQGPEAGKWWELMWNPGTTFYSSQSPLDLWKRMHPPHAKAKETAKTALKKDILWFPYIENIDRILVLSHRY